MAEKGFGVKEINLIGASGTPTIESPNNLNLNAVNVAISTNATVGGTLSVTGNVSVGGTLTYEDVTNIDSVGLITARSGVKVSAGSSINIGIAVTLSDGSNKGDLCLTGVSTAQRYQSHNGYSMDAGAYNNGYYINSGGNTILGMAYYSNNTIGLGGNGSSPLAFTIDDVASVLIAPKTGNTRLQFAEATKLETTNTGVTVTGTLAATAVTGDGSGLTSLPAATPTNSDIQVVYTVTANGSSAYRFAGNGVVSTADDPDLYLIRGQKYRFINNSGGSHPFQIREASGGTAYSTGVTNNGASSGNIDFAPTYDSPAQLVYQCTSHSGMVGNIYLRDAAGGNTNVGVTTFSGSVIVADTSAFTADTGADDLIVGSTNSGINRGITILNHTGQDGRLCFGQSGDPDAGMIKYSHGSDVMQFFVESSEKLRITSGGKLLVGRTSSITITGDGSSHVFEAITDNGYALATHSNTSNKRGIGIYYPTGGTAGDAIRFAIGSSAKFIVLGSGNVQNANNSYGNISDVSLKENIVDAGSQWNDIKNIKIRNYNFKESTGQETHKQIGVVAQELETVCPKLVSTDQDGMKNVASSVLYMKGMKALQEAMAKIETLEAEVAALKAK